MFSREFENIIQTFFRNNPNAFRVAIQISDKYIPLSLQITDWFSINYPSNFFFIVSDTSFNDCCVDFISADHLQADAIVHFGPYCCNKYEIPVCFLPDYLSVFELDNKITSEITDFINNIDSKNVLVILDQVLDSFEFIHNLCLAKNLCCYFAAPNKLNDWAISTKLFDFYFPLNYDDFKYTSLIYIGPHEKLAVDLGCIFYSLPSLFIDSKSSSPFNISISRELTKRSGIIDSILHFDHVGILVENPNVRLHVETAQYLQNICASNDVIADVIYVGRLNEVKIGNFPDIEFFIHLSCYGRSSFSYIKPVVSPYEFLCSKFDLNFWEYQYLRDFELFIAFCDINHYNTSKNDNENGDRQLIIKNFYELSNQIVSTRKNYSYNGLDINFSFQELRLRKGAIGNSSSYDYEKR